MMSTLPHRGAKSASQLLLCVLVIIFKKIAVVHAVIDAWAVTDWADAHATFYGGQDASGTMGGACGYGNLYTVGYGTASTALSNALFNHGLSCGACFLIECELLGTVWCYPGQSITVTATNQCPQGSFGGWCDAPRVHFDLSYPMFTRLAEAVGGVIPVRYKRVPCARHGGLRFTLYGNPWFSYVLVHNVGGGGDIAQLAIKGETRAWANMHHNWGQFWSLNAQFVGERISFRASLGNGLSQDFLDVADRNWCFDQTFEAEQNFH